MIDRARLFDTPTYRWIPAKGRVEVEYLADSGIAGGFPDGTFRPGGPVTRQAFAAFVHRYVSEIELGGHARYFAAMGRDAAR